MGSNFARSPDAAQLDLVRGAGFDLVRLAVEWEWTALTRRSQPRWNALLPMVLAVVRASNRSVA